jgi:serine/threonine protein kinase
MGFPDAPTREQGDLLSEKRSGTNTYSLPNLSPQILAGEPPVPADDTYAAAACIFELLTGKPVFMGGNVIAQIERKTPPTVSERRQELGLPPIPLPPALEDLLSRCLAKDRSERPSASEATAILAGATASNQATQTHLPTGTETAEHPTTSKVATTLHNLHHKNKHHLPKMAAALVVAACTWIFVLKPQQDELAERREIFNSLPQPPEDPLDSNQAEELKPLLADAEKAQKKWLTFLNDYQSENIPFTKEDDRQLRSARYSSEEWDDIIEHYKSKITAIERQQESYLTSISEAVLEANRKKADSTEEQFRTWISLEDRFAGDTTVYHSIPACSTWIQQIRDNLKTAREAWHKERADLVSDALFSTKNEASRLQTAAERRSLWQQFINSYDTEANRELQTIQQLLTDARAALSEEEKKFNEMIANSGQQLDQLQSFWESTQTSLADSTLTAKDKLSRLIAFSGDLKPVLLSAETNQNTELLANLKKLETDLNLQLDQWRQNAEPPPTAFPVAELFTDTEYAEWGESEKSFLLRKAQEKFKEQGLYTSTVDGKTGPGTHTAIIAFQEKLATTAPATAITAKLDAPTLKALELTAHTKETVISWYPQSSKTASTTKYTSKRVPGPPPMSIYDVRGGKMKEIAHRAAGKIDQAEWQKHLRYLAWEEKYGEAYRSQ